MEAVNSVGNGTTPPIVGIDFRKLHKSGQVSWKFKARQEQPRGLGHRYAINIAGRDKKDKLRNQCRFLKM